MDTPTELTLQSTKALSKDGNKLTKEATTTVAECLHIMSLAKNIKLMDGTLSVWDMLIADDIRAGKFELEDFVKAVNIGIRTPMYNRIDYSDIYNEANEIYKKRSAEIRRQKEIEDRRKPVKRDPIPEDIKSILGRFKNGRE